AAARRQRPLLGGPLLSAEGPARGGDLQVLRGGDEISEGRQGPGGALGAGESVSPDGELARRAHRLLEAHPRLPRIRRGRARAPEADPARELIFKPRERWDIGDADARHPPPRARVAAAGPRGAAA